MNEYNFFEWLYFLWINICSLNKFISLRVNKYIISLKLNKYNSLKLHKYTVAWCKIMPWVQIYFVECEYMYLLDFASFTNGQPQSTLSGHANKYKLWFISSLRTLRAESSWIPTKNGDLLCPHEKCLCVLTTIPPLKFAFSQKTSDRGCNLCGGLGKQTFGN